MSQQNDTGEKSKRARKNQAELGPPHKIHYPSQLNYQLNSIRRKIAAQEQIVYKEMKTSHPDFMTEYKKLNLLRMQETTIESRINNLDYFPGGYEVAEIVVNQSNNTNHHE